MSQKSHKKRKKMRGSTASAEVELNVMPFIDIFSLLCTFLLFSAVFVTIGVLEVQIPFLSNAAPDTKRENKRDLTVQVDVSRETVELTTSFTRPPINEETVKYPRTELGLSELHTKLVAIRTEHEDTDMVKLFVDDDITYNEIVKVLDEIKLRKSGDPSVGKKDEIGDENALFPKIIMGNVLL